MAHPNKDIRAAIKYATDLGWRFDKSGPRAHTFGGLYCPHGRGGCIVRVFSTPRSTTAHAQWIIGKVESCPHRPSNDRN